MSNSYVLVNPHIEGSLKTQVKAKNSLEAAKNLYKNLSEHFNNNVPKFHFTIEKISNPKFVRYGWKSYFEPNFFNKEGLPASSFSTINEF